MYRTYALTNHKKYIMSLSYSNRRCVFAVPCVCVFVTFAYTGKMWKSGAAAGNDNNNHAATANDRTSLKRVHVRVSFSCIARTRQDTR